MPQGKTKNVVRLGIFVGMIVIRIVLHGLFWQDLILVIGFAIGFMMTELDHWLYALMCNPQELACLRVKSEIKAWRLRSAWAMLKQTESERTKLPIHNALTGLIVAVMGVWLVTSIGNLLAQGLVFGLTVNLLTDFWFDVDHTKWYWLIARPITSTEDKIVKWVWTGLAIVCSIFLLR